MFLQKLFIQKKRNIKVNPFSKCNHKAWVKWRIIFHLYYSCSQSHPERLRNIARLALETA